MKKTLFLSLALLGSMAPAAQAQVSLVNPVPHRVETAGTLLAAPEAWQAEE